MPKGIYKHKPLSEEHKKKLSLSLTGIKHSEETKKRMSIGSIGKNAGKSHSKEHNQKVSLNNAHYWKGKKLSIETRKKMSLSHLGVKLSNNHKESLSNSLKGEKNPLYGKPLSEEHKRKIRENAIKNPNFGNKGKKFSEIHIQRIKHARAMQILPMRDTKIEVKIQGFLTSLHIEYLAHKYISEITHAYQCDIFIPVQPGINQKTIIECDGCYFHNCPECNLFRNSIPPKKILEKTELDKSRKEELTKLGYKMIRLWEHTINKITIDTFGRILNGK